MARTRFALDLFMCLGLLWSADGQRYVSFDAASASSAYSTGLFSADEALIAGSGYWCSSGNHMAGQTVTWTGMLNVRHKALGIRLNWAYSPGEFKILISSDGGNVEETTLWRQSTRGEVSFEETVMFNGSLSVKALTVVMKTPMAWGYFGINYATLLVEPFPFMIISGAASQTGEMCLIAGNTVSSEPCLDAIAAGDAREVFKFDGRQIQHVASKKCIATDSASRAVGLQECASAAQARDGRSDWALSSTSQLKMMNFGNYCLALDGGAAHVEDCNDASLRGDSADRYLFLAVQDIDADAASGVRSEASLLTAAASRQSKLLVGLQKLLPVLESCKPSFTGNISRWRDVLSLSRLGARTEIAHSNDPALIAIGRIYSVIGADMENAINLIRESSTTALAAEHKLAGLVS